MVKRIDMIYLMIAMILSGCVASDQWDLGGNLREYSEKYYQMELKNEMWIAPKVCGSACTLGLRNKKVCYTEDTTFYFHGVANNNGYDKSASMAFKKAMPKNIRLWAEKTGAFDSLEVVKISGADLGKIDGRICKK